MAWLFIALSTACFVSIYLLRRLLRPLPSSNGRPLPPGPTPLPVLGNLLDVPKTFPWRGYRQLSRQYGKIISLQAMGRCMVIIDDANTAVELLEKRSAIYSSRAHSVIVDLVGWGWNLAFMPYDQRWRTYRRMVRQYFSPDHIDKAIPVAEQDARKLLVRLLSSPDELVENVRYSLGATLIRTAYGLRTADTKDKYVDVFEEAMACMAVLASGTSILEFLPFLARVPKWLPGAGHLRLLDCYRERLIAMRDVPWEDAKKAAQSGEISSGPVSVLVDELARLKEEAATTLEEDAKNVLSVSYAAGIDTTHATLCSFFVALSSRPEIQAKARAELDAVVGPTRLPELADRERLPYVNAVVKETQRWHTVAPMGLPHVSSSDDEYNGYFIPEGSIVMVNAWSILHDPQMYPDPEEFNPDRFLKDGKLNPDIRDPATIAFGFGRRICPGQFLADKMLFIHIASVLHTLDVSRPVDDSGRPICIEPRVTDGLVTNIEDCRCTIRPRSAVAEALIRGVEFDA